MSMVKGYDFRRAKDRQRFIRELGERQPDAVTGRASRSTPNEEVLCARTGPGQCQWGNADDPACPRAWIIDHEHRRQLRLITTSMAIGRCVDKEKCDGRALSVCATRRGHGGEDVEDAPSEETVDRGHNMKVEEVHKDGDHEDMDA